MSKDTLESYELWVGVELVDEAGYAEYRRQMTPILHEYGGAFTLDVVVERVLVAPESATIHRLFRLRFSSEEAKDAFFADPRYRQIKERLFETSVASTTLLDAGPRGRP